MNGMSWLNKPLFGSRYRRRKGAVCRQAKAFDLQGQWFSLLYELLTVGFSLKQAISFSAILMPKSKIVVQLVDKQLAAGQTFAQALRPLVKMDVYYQLLLAEQHGVLVDTLHKISDFHRLCDRQKRKMRGLLEYPLILFAMLVMIASAMRGWLLPELHTMQAERLPQWWTIVQYSFFVLICAVVLYLLKQVLLFHHWSRLHQVEYLCQLPIFGRGFCNYYAYYICINLSLLVGEGISEKKICHYLQTYDTQSLLYQLAASYEASQYNLNNLVQRNRCLPKELCLLFNCGLSHNDLAQRLNILGQVKFRRLIQLSEHWLTVLQPMLLGLIALIVLGLYLSILLPIYHSMQGVMQ